MSSQHPDDNSWPTREFPAVGGFRPDPAETKMQDIRENGSKPPLSEADMKAGRIMAWMVVILVFLGFLVILGAALNGIFD